MIRNRTDQRGETMSTEIIATGFTSRSLIAAIATARARRIEREDVRDWVNPASHARFVALVDSAQAWADGDYSAIFVSVKTNHRDTEIWGCVAGDLADAACSDLGFPPSCHIAEVRAGLYRVSW